MLPASAADDFACEAGSLINLLSKFHPQDACVHVSTVAAVGANSHEPSRSVKTLSDPEDPSEIIKIFPVAKLDDGFCELIESAAGRWFT